MTIDAYPPDHIKVELALTTTPDDPAPVWVDVTAWADLASGVAVVTGRADEFTAPGTGTCRVVLNNSDGRFTAGNVSSPYYPNVKIRKKIRISYQNPSGPGPVAYRFTGYVEEWPCEWPGGNAYTAAQVSATDRFKRLGVLAPLRSIVEQEYLLDAPSMYYPLGEGSGSTGAGDASGNGRASLGPTQHGSGGTLEFGAGTGPGTDGLTAPIFTPVDVSNGKSLSRYVGGIVGYGDGLTLEAFAATTATVLQNIAMLGAGPGGYVSIRTTAAGKAEAFCASAVGTVYTLTSAASVNNGLTNHIAVTESISGGTLTARLYVNGVDVANTSVSQLTTFAGNTVYVGGGWPGRCFNGTISHAAAKPSVTTAARLLAHYQSGATGFSGERSDQRIARLASYAGIPTAEQDLEVGLSTSIAHVDITGQSPLQAMQDVAATEGGVLFMAGDGRLTFHGRSHRYNTTSTFTVSATDIDPNVRFVVNDQFLVNDVTATRAGGATARVINAASVTDYGTAATSLLLLTTSDEEVADAANWKANQSASLEPRLPNLTIDLMTSPALTAAAMLLTVGSRVTLTDLPAQASAASVDLFVEGHSETITATGWVLMLNLSPAEDSSVWQLDSALYSQLDVSTRLAY